MARNARGTIVARLLALCLLALAAAVTSSLPAIEPSDLDHSQPANTSHHAPARELTESLVTVGQHLVAAVLDQTSARVASLVEIRPVVVRPSALVNSLRVNRAVLRL